MRECRCADGGRHAECYKDPAWGQVNIRTVPPGAKAGGHRHPLTNERWLLLRGSKVLVTMEGWSFHLPLWMGVDVPAGTGHAVENLGEDEAVLLYWRDTIYDPDKPDKEEWDERAG